MADTSRARIRRTRQTSQAIQYSSTAASAYLSSLFTGVSLLSTAGAASLVVPAAPALPALGLYLYLNRQRFPGQDPQAIAQAAWQSKLLAKKGLDPLVVTNPYTGELTIATKDQPIDLLLAYRAVQTLTPKVDTAPIYAAREELIQKAADTALERGFYPSVASLPKIPRNLVCGVTRKTADSPLEYVCRSRT